MKPELFWLTLTTTMTALLWMPYIVNRMLEIGVFATLDNPKPGAAPTAAWATRMLAAHKNAVENLAVFAPLVLVVAIADISSPTTIQACQLYFFARATHFIVYTLGIPGLRTTAFIAGFIAQITLAFAIFGAA